MEKRKTLDWSKEENREMVRKACEQVNDIVEKIEQAHKDAANSKLKFD